MASHGAKIFHLAALLQVFCNLAVGSEPNISPDKRLKLLYYTASDDGSHHLTNTKIAAALVRRGHDVTFLLSNSYTKWRNASDANLFKFVVHRSMYTPEDRQRNLRSLSRASLNGDMQGIWRMTKFFILMTLFSSDKKDLLYTFHFDECDSLLGDNDTIRRLREEEFDLLVGEDLSDCHPLLAEMLGVRFVLVSGTSIIPSKGSWYGIPRHPAYIPERQCGFSDTMTLQQRVVNTYMYFVHEFSRRFWAFRGLTALQRKYNLSPDKQFPELLARAELWLFYGDFGLEYARPLQPNVILLISPMLGLPSDEKIPTDQQEFIDSAHEGVVLFTLGSHVNEMEPAQAQMFADGLAKLSQRVIWQFAGSSAGLNISSNTKVVRWMPQQQIMAHPNVKAFLSHGGLNGMYEAAWYGLPMVGIPLFGDHFDNMKRAVSKGFALQLDINTLSEDILSEAVTRVIQDPSFRTRAQHLSEIFRDHPVIPSEKAAFWIAHVGRFGGAHLRPRAADLTWIEHNLVDVYAVLGAILCGVLGVLYLVCRGCLWCVCRGRGGRQLKLKVN